MSMALKIHRVKMLCAVCILIHALKSKWVANIRRLLKICIHYAELSIQCLKDQGSNQHGLNQSIWNTCCSIIIPIITQHINMLSWQNIGKDKVLIFCIFSFYFWFIWVFFGSVRII